ncbi:MAG: hypothetical protein HY826_00670 [Actinobacteria bacterium]|nr:hypothetical protein [Actinomycetota bacterium]
MSRAEPRARSKHIVSRTSLVVMLLAAVTACTAADSADPNHATTTASTTPVTAPAPSIAATTSTSSTSTSTTTTTTLPVIYTGVLRDVVVAASLAAVPEGTPVSSARQDRSPLYGNGCHVGWGATKPKDGCVFGDTSSDVVVVVTGDSHATAWFGAFDEAGKANHWKIVTVDKAGCPAADVRVYSAAYTDRFDVPYPACDAWRENALEYIALLHPDLVVFPMMSRRGVVGHGGASGLTEWGAGLGRSLDAVSAPGTKLLVIGDAPKTNGDNIPKCVSNHRNDVAECGNSRVAAVRDNRLAVLAEAARAHHATFVDPSNWFCTATFCPAVIGDLVVYRDEHHLTDSFARYRAPQIANSIRFALASNP